MTCWIIPAMLLADILQRVALALCFMPSRRDRDFPVPMPPSASTARLSNSVRHVNNAAATAGTRCRRALPKMPRPPPS